MSDRWIGRETDSPIKTYARFCREHDFRLADGTLHCPFPPGVGHDIEPASTDAEDEKTFDEDLEGFVTREIAAPQAPEKLRAFRDAFIWAAGVFDARGSCHATTYRATNGRRYHKVVVRIRAGERKNLDEIVATTGLGTVFKRTTSDESFGGERERYEYQLQGWTAVRFLMAIWPSLRGKRAFVAELLAGPVSGPVE